MIYERWICTTIWRTLTSNQKVVGTLTKQNVKIAFIRILLVVGSL